jgi:hypothetical protein
MSVPLHNNGDAETWRQVLAHMANNVNSDCFQTWFSPIVFLGRNEASFHLSVPSEGFRARLLEHHADALRDAVIKATGTAAPIEISVQASTENESPDAPDLSPLPVVQAAALAASNSRHRWLIEGLWMDQAVGILGGQPKCGKTWMALEMAVSVASGAPCLGAFPVYSRGPVLFYAAEDNSTALRARIETLACNRGVDFQSLDLRIITVSSLRMDLPHDQNRLEATVALHRPVLLVLDPLVRIHMADENVSSQMAALLGYFRNLQRKTGTAIALTHHSRKNASSGVGAGYNLRGSSDLYAFVDSFLYMRKNRDQLTLSAEHRAAPGFGPITLELASSASMDGSVHLKIVSSSPQTESSAAANPLHSRVLELLSRSAEPLTVDSLRSKLQVRNQRLVEALRQLSDQGKVERSPCGYIIKSSIKQLPDTTIPFPL